MLIYCCPATIHYNMFMHFYFSYGSATIVFRVHMFITWEFDDKLCQTTSILLLSFNWNHFEMWLLYLRINFYLLLTFCPHIGSFRVVSSFTTFRLKFTAGLLQVIFNATSDRNAESCNRIPSNYCFSQLLSISPHFWPSKPLTSILIV